jgi:hypothetical protein
MLATCRMDKVYIDAINTLLLHMHSNCAVTPARICMRQMKKEHNKAESLRTGMSALIRQHLYRAWKVRKTK